METTQEPAAEKSGDGRRRERASENVIDAVAAATGLDPLGMEPLYSVVDPDALDALFGQSGESAAALTLHFTMEGCEVVVHGDGEVLVVPPLELEDGPAAVTAQD